jgi:hypothetical protein
MVPFGFSNSTNLYIYRVVTGTGFKYNLLGSGLHSNKNESVKLAVPDLKELMAAFQGPVS